MNDQQAGAQTVSDKKYMQELGLSNDALVQELGWDEDIDFEFRNGLEDELGEELLTEEDQEPVDAVLLWWRSDDGDVMDLADAMEDATTNLDEERPGSAIWLLTPRNSQPGHVSAIDIEEACNTAGLRSAANVGVSEDWSATRLEFRPNA